jgi:hypothetical protein
MTPKECIGCNRSEEIMKGGRVRPIKLDAAGNCAACRCAEEEAKAAAEDKLPKCPDCGNVLDLQRDVEVDEPYFPTHPLRDQPLPRKRRIAKLVAFCNGCEYAEEVGR